MKIDILYFLNRFFVFIALFYCYLPDLSAQEIETVALIDSTSFRGIASIGDQVVWVSGSLGTVGRSIDGGNSWEWISPKGYESFDFRDIEVFAKDEALIMSAGSPAIILRTEDGGCSWQEVYRDERPEIFLDGMDFDGKRGFIIGDPIDGVFQVLQSLNRGKIWSDVSQSMYLFADDGEAAFAASGTSVQLLGDDLYIGTGGLVSNIFIRKEKKRSVIKLPVPVTQGTSSKGIFSIACWNRHNIIVVGGDYLDDGNSLDAVFITHDAGLNWNAAHSPLSGYKSCVQYLSKDVIIATGTSGTDISRDGGLNWTQISSLGFHCLSANKNMKTVFLAGQGRIAKIVL